MLFLSVELDEDEEDTTSVAKSAGVLLTTEIREIKKPEKSIHFTVETKIYIKFKTMFEILKFIQNVQHNCNQYNCRLPTHNFTPLI